MSGPRRPWMVPLVPLYSAGAALSLLGLKPKSLAWPVISVGNLSAGGTGKTPFVVALAQLLKREGIYVDVLSRGYGRVSSEAAEVAPNGSAKDYGDEPLLIAREATVPVYVAAQRFEAGQFAEAMAATKGIKAGVHLLDDGFQHRQLSRQVDIVLVNSEDLYDWLLPAGNLREGTKALQRAGVIAVPTEDGRALSRLQEMRLKQPIWRFRREMRVPEIPGPVVAFCGIARPGQFFSGLERAGVQITERHAFPDHHAFSAQDVELLRNLAAKSGASALVTTAKDQIRLGPLVANLESIAPVPTVYIVDLRVVFDDEPAVSAWLREALSSELHA